MPEKTLTRFLTRHDTTLTFLCRAGFAASVLGVIVLSLLPQEAMPKVELSDKVGHFVAYTAVAALGLLGFRGAVLRVVIGTVLLGGALEIAQIYIPGRAADLLDFAVDVAGIAVGLLLTRLLLPLWMRPGEPATNRAS